MANEGSKLINPEGAFGFDDALFVESRKRFNESNVDSEKKLISLNTNKFKFIKDLLILAGTFFGSSIALASGKTINEFFFLGECFLFISVIIGIGRLLADIKGQEWDHAFFSLMAYESFLSSGKNKMETTERKIIEDGIATYNRILKRNQSGILIALFKIVKHEGWETLFFSTLIIGLALITLSLMFSVKNVLQIPMPRVSLP